MSEQNPSEAVRTMWFAAFLAVMIILIGALVYVWEALHEIKVRPLTEEEAREVTQRVCGRPVTLLVPDGGGAAVIDRVEDVVYVGANGATLAIVGTGQVRCAVCASLGAGSGAWIMFDGVPGDKTLGRWQGACHRRAVRDNLSWVARLPGGEQYRAAAAAQTRRLMEENMAETRRRLQESFAKPQLRFVK